MKQFSAISQESVKMGKNGLADILLPKSPAWVTIEKIAADAERREYNMQASLIMENGAVFQGESIGDTAPRLCEMVFNTSMTGYQEILTDPSYAGQGIIMTYPLIGNYGVNHEDNESVRPWAEAFIVRHLAQRGSNFRREADLNDYLKEHHITGIQHVDTRALTRLLRTEGTMNALITCAEVSNMDETLQQVRAYRVEGTVEKVSRKKAEICPAEGESRYRVALMDYGVKANMIRCLQKRGCEVTVFPAATPASTILAGGFNGVMLSNGPGNPADNVSIIGEIKKLYQSSLPLFAVCLGHQLLALATGATTQKMRFGHRGGNHPVKDLIHGRVFITSQNHGYVVQEESVNAAIAKVSHINVNDGSVEGLEYVRPNCFTVQFHPEASPGPMDTEYLFDRFIASMEKGSVR